jgi:hypothetical protein
MNTKITVFGKYKRNANCVIGIRMEKLARITHMLCAIKWRRGAT